MIYAMGMAKTKQIGFRVPESEYQRLMTVYERAKKRTMGYAPLGDVIREAVFGPPQKITTQEERDFLAGRISALSEPDHHGTAEELPLRPVRKRKP